jgi:hypothetical protein
MQFWDSMIHTAMMGTDKMQSGNASLPADLAEAAALINNNVTIDKEEKFLQLISVAYNYRQSGLLAMQKEVVMTPALQEEKKYCNEAASHALKDILSEENMALLKLWLEYCERRQQIAGPESVPLLLSAGMQQKKLQLLVASCCGRRGEWLSRFNEVWNFSGAQSPEELWQTGSTEQRIEILRETRKTDPAKAREWLQQTWAQEDAATRYAFLEVLVDNIRAADISFLENLSHEKSKKVKELATDLLKKIPESPVVQQYQELLGRSVIYKKEKSLLGMMSKNVLHFQLTNIPDAIFKSGIDKLSSQKGISDEIHILYQLINYTPPSFWEKQLMISPAEIITLFKKTDQGKQLYPALALAAGWFRDKNWIPAIIGDESTLYSDLVGWLPKQEREQYLLKFINSNATADEVVRIAVKEETEWGIELTKAIFRHTARNLYQYSRSFYGHNIGLIPVEAADILEKCAPGDESLRVTWTNTSNYITKLLSLKNQTIKAFNS